MTLAAPAKINLTLEVLKKRPDGYHEIRSVLQTVSLCDSLSFEGAASILFQCDDPSWRSEKSLVVRAADRLKVHCGSPRGALVRIAKLIPLSSGLGGDSSDAAAVLAGLNRLWRLGIGPGELVEMAAELGSDVPFFLTGGTALAQGRGERIRPLPAMLHAWIVLLIAPVERPQHKTGALYGSLNPEAFTDGSRTDAVVVRLNRGEAIRPDDFFNIFETVAFKVFDGLEKYRDGFQDTAGTAVHLAGAGPGMFAIFSDSEKAAGVWGDLKERGLEAYLTQTCNSPEL